MIDEIPIIGVTEWTVDGLAAKEFAEGLGHRAPSGRSTGEQGGEGKSGGQGLGDRTLSISSLLF